MSALGADIYSGLLFVQEGAKSTAAVTEKSIARTPALSRSVGSMKCQLSGFVRPKPTAQSAVTSSANQSSTVTCRGSAGSGLDSQSNCQNIGPNSSEQLTSSSSTVSAGLAGLGAYSSSSSSDNDEETS